MDTESLVTSYNLANWLLANGLWVLGSVATLVLYSWSLHILSLANERKMQQTGEDIATFTFPHFLLPLVCFLIMVGFPVVAWLCNIDGKTVGIIGILVLVFGVFLAPAFSRYSNCHDSGCG